MYLVRPTRSQDLDAIVELAAFLDSPNLPADREFLAARLERSAGAFDQPGPPSVERDYQLALVDASDRVVGTCAILSKHGTPGLPHLYLKVGEETRHSPTVRRTVTHTTLQLGATEDGPTELGALVLHPDHRGKPGRPGTLLSWVRFAYIARHRACFEARVLAEMRASLDGWGRSAFWNAFGKRFTEMTYAEADRLSATDKRFILELFPEVPFYASLLDREVAAQLGQVHEETRPALRLLERAGLGWIGEIDPFDGGPFVGAATGNVVPVRETVQGTLAGDRVAEDAEGAIVSSEEGGGFRAVIAPAIASAGEIRVAKDACTRLGICTGDDVAITPLPARSAGPRNVLTGESHG